MLLAALGGVAGLLIAQWTQHLLWSLRPPFFPQDFAVSLDARVLVSARRFRDLGVSAPRELPDIPPVHLEMREPRAAELRSDFL